jgi:hypothetical protein
MNIEESAEGFPKCGSELRATVRGDDVGNTKAGNPCVKQSGGTVGGGGGRKGNNFWPACGTVNYSKNVCETLGGGQRANKIYMDVGKFTMRDGNMVRDSLGVVVNLSGLANGTLAGPLSYLFRQTRPNKS